jgi:hypothetical protein
MPSRSKRTQDSGLGQRLDGADDPCQRPAEPVERHDDDGVVGADVVQQRCQAGPVVATPDISSVKIRSQPAAVRASRCWSSDWWPVLTRA